MGEVVSIQGKKRSGRGRALRFEKIKDELLRFHGIDLDNLLSKEPATSLSVEQFEDLTERLLTTVDDFCEEHPTVMVQDILYTLENVKEIVRDNASVDDEE